MGFFCNDVIVAIATHGAWWEIFAALFTPATIVCGYVARKARQLGDHLERQDQRAMDHAERLARLEGAAGLKPRPAGET